MGPSTVARQSGSLAVRQPGSHAAGPGSPAASQRHDVSRRHGGLERGRDVTCHGRFSAGATASRLLATALLPVLDSLSSDVSRSYDDVQSPSLLSLGTDRGVAWRGVGPGRRVTMNKFPTFAS